MILAMCVVLFSCAKSQDISFEHDIDGDAKSVNWKIAGFF